MDEPESAYEQHVQAKMRAQEDRDLDDVPGSASKEMTVIRAELAALREVVAAVRSDRYKTVSVLRALAILDAFDALHTGDTPPAVVEPDPLEGLMNGCGNGAHHLADHLAQAWLVISRAEEGDGKSNRYYPELPGYVDEDWSKMVARRIQGYARLHARPTHFPWRAPEFDQFSWVGRQAAQ